MNAPKIFPSFGLAMIMQGPFSLMDFQTSSKLQSVELAEELIDSSQKFLSSLFVYGWLVEADSFESLESKLC